MTSAAFNRSAARHHSPLRYPGGKAKLAGVVKAVFRDNRLFDGVYVEPYAGGASIALTLLFEEIASKVKINDIDAAVYAFWHSVLNETEAFCRLVTDTKVTTVEWKRQRSIYLRRGQVSQLKLGFAAFFLNRTNRSGIIGSGGMIGGTTQQGAWKLDARYHASNLVARIERVAQYRDRINLTRLDALKFLQECALELPSRSLVYLDPPYFLKGQQGLYSNSYEDDDHQSIAEALDSVPFHWIVSYDDEADIRGLYRSRRAISYSLRYTAAEQEQGREVMFFSDGLRVPRVAGHRARAPLRRPRQASRTS